MKKFENLNFRDFFLIFEKKKPQQYFIEFLDLVFSCAYVCFYILFIHLFLLMKAFEIICSVGTFINDFVVIMLIC